MSVSTTKTLALFACLVLLSGGAAHEARAQSLLSAGGLGTPIEPLGGRARGLGSVGVGLFGGSILPTDPMGALSVPIPSVTGTLQPTTGTLSGLGPDSEVSTTRFPLFGVAYPAGENDVLVLTLGGFLDQNWASRVDGTVDLAGEPVPVTDSFESDGGVSTFRLSWARRLGSSVGVAVTGGVHVGELARTFTRQFDSTGVASDVEPFTQTGRWRLTGPTASVGVSWERASMIRVAATVTWSGDLEARPQDGSGGGEQDFELPLEYRIGASAALTPRLALTGGLVLADWSETGESLNSGESSGQTVSVGGGIEWSGPRVANRNLPIRLGLRRSELPFRFGQEDPTETVIATGFGINFVESDGVPLASVDLGLEFGSRDAGPVSEDFLRVTASLRVSGN